MDTLILATRGSPLALWQANEVKRRLQACRPGLDVSLRIVKTLGDRDKSTTLPEISATGVFTKEVDAHVLDGSARGAVHSLKDQLTTLPDGLVLGMVLPRGPVEDVLVSAFPGGLPGLRPGMTVGTGSFRRQAQLRRLRPDLLVRPVRGNVEGRLDLVRTGAVDGVVLARAGIERLGLSDRISEVLDLLAVLPAPGQGIVGVTCREDDAFAREVFAAADDARTRRAAEAERAFLRDLHGGCNVPAAAFARSGGDGDFEIRARVLSLDGAVCLDVRKSGSREDAAGLGSAAARDLLDRGAGPWIAAHRP